MGKEMTSSETKVCMHTNTLDSVLLIDLIG